ncbi:MAG: ABC transporter permease [Coriobacteriia bacterium]|nr:ABC transporter permease [Coriobacteriia bacterium]
MNWKHVRLLIWKEFLQLRRDPILLALLLILPVLQLVMLGYVVGADVKHLSTAVVDLDRTVTSRRLAESFASSGYYDITQRPAKESDLRPLLDRGDVKVALVIPEGTESRVSAGEAAPVGIVVDGSDSRTASVGSGYASQLIAVFNAKRIAEQGISIAGPGIDARVRVEYNPSLRAVNSMVPSLLATILLLTMSSVMSQAVVGERERGTLELMFVTPISRGEYLVGKLTPYILIGVVQMSLTALVGRTWFGVPFHGQLWVAVLGLFLFMLTTVALGLFISLVSHTRQQAQQVVIFIMLPFFVLSGFIFPVASMPTVLQVVTYAIPLRYAIEILRGTFIQGAGARELIWQLLALAGFSVVMLTLALFSFHKRLSD